MPGWHGLCRRDSDADVVSRSAAQFDLGRVGQRDLPRYPAHPAKEPEATAQLDAQLDQARGLDPLFETALAAHRARWPGIPPEAEARWFAESLATLLTASIMLEQSPVAGQFIATRLGGARGQIAGAMPGFDAEPVLARV